MTRRKRVGTGRLAQRIAAIALAVTTTGAVSAPTAMAAETPNWYDSSLGYADFRARGIDGSGVTIAVAETGVDLNSPDLQGADIEFVPLPGACAEINELSRDMVNIDGSNFEDNVQHGTNVAAMIVGQGGDGIQGVAPGAKLLVMEIPFAMTPDSPLWPADCDPAVALVPGRMMASEELGADIFSVSQGSQPGGYESAYWLMRGKALVVAAGNYANEVAGAAAGLPGVVTVTATTPGNAEKADWAPGGPEVTVGAPGESIMRHADGGLSEGQGTSYATPIVAGTLALGRQQWPDATYNQLIQSLTANASGKGQRSDALGFGAIDPVAFIDDDPMQYPDEPIIQPDSSNADPQWDYVRAVCFGDVDDSTMRHTPNYRMDAGIDPSKVEWLPQVAKDEGWLGAAIDAAYWGDSAPEATTDADSPEVLEDDPVSTEPEVAVSFLPIILGIVAALAIGAIVVAVLLSRRRRRGREGQHPMAAPHQQGPLQPGQYPAPQPGYYPPVQPGPYPAQQPLQNSAQYQPSWPAAPQTKPAAQPPAFDQFGQRPGQYAQQAPAFQQPGASQPPASQSAQPSGQATQPADAQYLAQYPAQPGHYAPQQPPQTQPAPQSWQVPATPQTPDNSQAKPHPSTPQGEQLGE